MVARPGQPNETPAAGKDVPATTSGELKTEPFQGESPFQSKDGLTQIRGVADKTGQVAAGVPEVTWAATVEKSGDAQKTPLETASGKPEITKQSTGDQISGMILKNGDGSARTLEQIRQSNPKLAGEIDKAVQLLSNGKTPDELKETLRVMGELYKGMDPRLSDNRESKQALERARRNPEYVPGIMNKANELIKLPPEKREKEIRKLKIEIRGMHLDGGNL